MTILAMRGLLLWVFLQLPSVTVDALAGFSIPGTTQTLSGYDTELGPDAICWKSQGSIGTDKLIFVNPLVANFRLDDRVELLKSCPVGNALTATAPAEFLRGEIMRTGQWYNYTVTVSLDLFELDSVAPFVVSDEGPVIAVQILVCELGRAGFCSPFIHEEANARLNALNITGKPARGDRHGGTHVHSSFQLVELLPENGPIYDFTVTVPMLINEPGNFFAIADVQLYLGNIETKTRYDMANALTDDQRLISYQAPAEILEVQDSVRIFSYVAIAAVGAIIGVLLFQTVRHRKHQVLRLTQGYFLMIFLSAALTATLASFLLEPKNDTYCRSARPVILCSVQLLYAVILGRLWRINAVISPLLVQTLRQQKGWTHKFMQVLRKISLMNTKNNRPKNLRRQIDSGQLALIIAAFTAPQVLIQILGAAIQPPYQHVDYNSDESMGRPYCNSGSSPASSIIFYGYICFGLLILILLVMAHHARTLPSLFNESQDIFNATLTTIVIFALGGGIITVADSPTTSPAVLYLVEVALTLSITLNTSVRIMMPKLRMIWNGEIVLVSKLVSDHKRSVKEDNNRYESHRSNSSMTAEATLASERQLESSRFSGMASSYSNDLDPASLVKVPSTCHTDLDESPPYSSLDFSPDLGPKNNSPDHARRTYNGRLQSKRHCIVIKQDEAPARRLVLKLVGLHNSLGRVNDRITSGKAVSEEDWASLRLMTTKLGSTFKNEVEFSWERVQDQASGRNERHSINDLDGEERIRKVTFVKRDNEDFGDAADVEQADWVEGERVEM